MIVPFVWTDVMSQGFVCHLDSALRRIPSFLSSTFWPTSIPPSFSWASLRSASRCLCYPIFCQSAMNRMSNSISCLNIAARGKHLSTVWEVKQTAHAASDKKTSMSLGLTVSAILSLDMHNMFPRTAWIHLSIAFACGFLTLVGLRLIPYVLHRDWKWSLNLFLLLYIMYCQCGYLINQVSYTRLLIWAELLSK